jgi:prolipoprotein diacylglyceryltransferase
MKTSTTVLYWTARILCILAILVVSLFLWEKSVIPSFVLLALLIIAWKWEKVGGIILTIFGLAFSIFIFVFNYQRNHFPIFMCLLQTLLIAIPFVLAGILFILSHYRKKKELSGARSQTPPQS